MYTMNWNAYSKENYYPDSYYPKTKSNKGCCRKKVWRTILTTITICIFIIFVELLIFYNFSRGYSRRKDRTKKNSKNEIVKSTGGGLTTPKENCLRERISRNLLSDIITDTENRDFEEFQQILPKYCSHFQHLNLPDPMGNDSAYTYKYH